MISIILLTFHLLDNVVRGLESGGINNVFGMLILVVWLYGILVLTGRLSGYIIVLLGSILGTGIPIVNMRGMGLIGSHISASGGAFFFVWTRCLRSA